MLIVVSKWYNAFLVHMELLLKIAMKAIQPEGCIKIIFSIVQKNCIIISLAKVVISMCGAAQ